MNPTASTEFHCDVQAPAAARTWGLDVARTLLDGLPDELAGALEVVISELVTNALRAECETVRVSLSVDADTIRVGVEDDAPGRPTLLRPAATDTHGRGLLIVTMLAAEWGVRALSAGKEVWAELRAE
jgi:anti-sigma regulatory factor (Ser/Thr protein kinase)